MKPATSKRRSKLKESDIPASFVQATKECDVLERRMKLAKEIVDFIFQERYGKFERKMRNWFSYKLIAEAMEQILKRHKV